jgi:RHS repeat-associated protein
MGFYLSTYHAVRPSFVRRASEGKNLTPAVSSCTRKSVARRLRLQERGARFYSAILARWISRDPIEEEGSLNLYGFVRNNAVSLYDLLGQYPGGFLTGIPAANFLDSTSVQSVTAPDSSGTRLIGPKVLFEKIKVYCVDSAIGTSLQKEIGELSITMAADVDRRSSVPGTKLAVLDRHLGVYIDVTFTVTDQENLNDCCQCGGDVTEDGDQVAWIQYRRIPNLGSSDLRVDDGTAGYGSTATPEPHWMPPDQGRVLRDYPGFGNDGMGSPPVHVDRDFVSTLRCKNKEGGAKKGENPEFHKYLGHVRWQMRWYKPDSVGHRKVTGSCDGKFYY